MARIPLTNGFTLIPEGTYVFRIYAVEYDETFGVILIKLVNAKGQTLQERFTIKDSNDEPNDKALNAFSYFAKAALNDYGAEDVDPEVLVDRYIEAEVIHNEVPSTKKEGEMMTFANLGDKAPADGFDEEPVARALTLGKEDKKAAKKSTPKAAPEAKEEPKKGLDLDALLG